MRRSDIRWELIDIAGGLKKCPLCATLFPDTHPKFGTQCHEIIYESTPGQTKYQNDDSPFMVPENCILLCDRCNSFIGGGRAYIEQLLTIKMSDPDWLPRDVIPVLKQIAATMKCPEQVIPHSVKIRGTTYVILDTTSTERRTQEEP